jgi:hypothetical protein
VLLDGGVESGGSPFEGGVEAGGLLLGGGVESGGLLLTGVEAGQPTPNRAHKSTLVLVGGVSVTEGGWLDW